MSKRVVRCGSCRFTNFVEDDLAPGLERALEVVEERLRGAESVRGLAGGTTAIYGEIRMAKCLAKALRAELKKTKGGGGSDSCSGTEIEFQAESWECAMMHLDDIGVPRRDKDGEEYSLVGRIGLLGDTK